VQANSLLWSNILKCFHGWLIFALLFTGCTTTSKDKSGLTFIKGNIQLPASGKIYFYSYADSIDFYLARQSPVDSVTVAQNGDFAFELKIDKPYVFSLQHDKKTLVSSLFINPGDQLEIRFYGKQHLPRITPFGPEAKFNTYLLNFIDTFYNETNRHNEYYIASNYMDLQQYATYTDKRKREMLAFFNGYFNNDTLKTVYSDFAIQSICYELASDRIMYLWKKRMKGEPVIPDSAYLNYADPSFVENSKALITPSYIRFINLYLKDVFERMVETGTLPANEGDSLIVAVEKYKLALKLFNPPFRDVVLFNLLINEMNVVTDSEVVSSPGKAGLDTLISLFEKKYDLN
jgi:hypothetical protein